MLRKLWWRDTCQVGTLSLGYRGIPWRQVLLYIHTLNKLRLCVTLIVPHISLMLCMLSCGDPTSRVGIPSLVDIIGPIVLPQATSLRTTKSWKSNLSFCSWFALLRYRLHKMHMYVMDNTLLWKTICVTVITCLCCYDCSMWCYIYYTVSYYSHLTYCYG